MVFLYQWRVFRRKCKIHLDICIFTFDNERTTQLVFRLHFLYSNDLSCLCIIMSCIFLKRINGIIREKSSLQKCRFDSALFQSGNNLTSSFFLFSKIADGGNCLGCNPAILMIVSSTCSIDITHSGISTISKSHYANSIIGHYLPLASETRQAPAMANIYLAITIP